MIPFFPEFRIFRFEVMSDYHYTTAVDEKSIKNVDSTFKVLLVKNSSCSVSKKADYAGFRPARDALKTGKSPSFKRFCKTLRCDQHYRCSWQCHATKLHRSTGLAVLFEVVNCRT